MSLAGKNLLDGPAPTLLPEESELLARIAEGAPAVELAREFPKSSLAWSLLAEEALAAGKSTEGYAFARVGYHRGLDALRGHGWRGHGAVPYSHEPNRGFLKALYLLGVAASEIGEIDEVERINKFLDDSDPAARKELKK